MSPLVTIVLIITIALPVAWFISEFFARRWLRLVLGTLAVLMSFGVACIAGSLERFSSNTWFGGATKELIDTTIAELEAGHQPDVLEALKSLQATYHPTYENRARYDELVRATVARMTGPATTQPTLHERASAALVPGDGLQQMQLAHIGHIETSEGRYEVFVQRLVVTGMLAPRGQRHLHLLKADGRVAASYRIPDAEPLWCEAGKIYLFGLSHIPGISVDPVRLSQLPPDALYTGNVIDLSQGIDHAVLRRENRYGSSGGIEDDAEVLPER